MRNFINFCKITFSNNVSDVILTSKILENTKVFQKFKPLFKRTLFWQFTHSTVSSEYNHLVNKSDYDTLFEIEILRVVSTKLSTKDDGLGWFLKWNQIHLAILHINNFTSTVWIIIILKFVKFTFEKDKISLFCRF